MSKIYFVGLTQNPNTMNIAERFERESEFVEDERGGCGLFACQLFSLLACSTLSRVKIWPPYSENRRIEVIDFLDFLIQRERTGEGDKDLKRAISAVEDTWGSKKLDNKTLEYIAEDKEMEYEAWRP